MYSKIMFLLLEYCYSPGVARVLKKARNEGKTTGKWKASYRRQLKPATGKQARRCSSATHQNGPNASQRTPFISGNQHCYQSSSSSNMAQKQPFTQQHFPQHPQQFAPHQDMFVQSTPVYPMYPISGDDISNKQTQPMIYPKIMMATPSVCQPQYQFPPGSMCYPQPNQQGYQHPYFSPVQPYPNMYQPVVINQPSSAPQTFAGGYYAEAPRYEQQGNSQPSGQGRNQQVQAYNINNNNSSLGQHLPTVTGPSSSKTQQAGLNNARERTQEKSFSSDNNRETADQEIQQNNGEQNVSLNTQNISDEKSQKKPSSMSSKPAAGTPKRQSAVKAMQSIKALAKQENSIDAAPSTVHTRCTPIKKRRPIPVVENDEGESQQQQSGQLCTIGQSVPLVTYASMPASTQMPVMYIPYEVQPSSWNPQLVHTYR